MPPRFSSISLSSQEHGELLALGRSAIFEAVVHQYVVDVPPLAGALAEPRGAFVTLTRSGRLRGCIGCAEARRGLAETVVQCAIGAALHDPRFSAVKADELHDLRIEISILSELLLLQPESLKIGTHGLLIIRDDRRGLLLPRVAKERQWSVGKFLDETCRKAGLAAGAWRDVRTQVYGFTVDAFSEADYPPVRAASYSSST